MKSARIRPSKPLSAIAAVIATVFAVAGLAGIIAIFGWFPQAWLGGLFFCLWTFVAGSMAVFHWINALSSSGVSMLNADTISSHDAPSSSNRLKELEKLKTEGLISSQEYSLKREDILKEL